MGNIGVWAPFVFHLSLSARCGGGGGEAARPQLAACGVVLPWREPLPLFVLSLPRLSASRRPTQARAPACVPVWGCRAQAGPGGHGAGAPRPTCVGAA